MADEFGMALGVQVFSGKVTVLAPKTPTPKGGHPPPGKRHEIGENRGGRPTFFS